MLSAVVVGPKGLHKATLIFAHGLGDSGYGWSRTFEQLNLSGIKYVFPNAPSIPVTLNNNMIMTAWYDIYQLSEEAKEDEEGVKRSAREIHKLIDHEVETGLASNNIFIGGFSQGAAVSLYAGITYPGNLAGLIALSSYFPLRRQFTSFSVSNKGVKIFQAHGKYDDIVSYEWGKKSYEYLKSLNLPVTFKTYENLGHHSSAEEMADIKCFIQNLINNF
ncbi:acyl-protein thioesterase 1-like [Zophobas morio]|uniref:acyl-protein thioesterase 1-like n=1 Tax=Zophobas morio TaxID=2755281 RepID=UPI003083A228